MIILIIQVRKKKPNLSPELIKKGSSIKKIVHQSLGFGTDRTFHSGSSDFGSTEGPWIKTSQDQPGLYTLFSKQKFWKSQAHCVHCQYFFPEHIVCFLKICCKYTSALQTRF